MWRASNRARDLTRRPKPFTLPRGPLLDEVSKRLVQFWLPQENSKRLRLRYPDDPEMDVSHETIYRS